MLWHKLQGAGGIGGVPIEYVGGYTQSYLGTTSDISVDFGGSLTGGSGSSAAADDLVIFYFGIGYSGTTAPTPSVSGYTSITNGTAGVSTYRTRLLVSYKTLTDTNNTFTISGGTGNANWAGSLVVQVFRNVSSTPLDVTSQTANSGSSVLCNPPAITPVTKGAWILAGGAGAHNRGTDTFSSSDLSNFRTVGGDDGSDVTVGAGYYTGWTSGSFNPAAFTFSDTDNTTFSNRSVTIALTPAIP